MLGGRMSQKVKDHTDVIDDSGHNLDEQVINVLNELAHEPSPQSAAEPTESFFVQIED
jgi:hypothetical protein